MKQRTKIGPATFHCIEIDSMPQNTPTITPKATDIYTTVYASTVREHSTTDGASYRIHSSWSSPTRARELNSPMAAGLPGSSFGVLLPVCLLGMFLSCVVCVYHWQGTRERRLDLEDDRKRMRKRKLSEVDSGCAWRTVKPVYKSKVPAYPWKSTRIQDLPDINNNDEFHIPLFPEVKHGSGRYHGDSFRHSVAVGHFSEHHEKPIPKRTSIHNKPGCITGELSEFSYASNSEANFCLSLPSFWSEDAATESCAIVATRKENPGFSEETGTDVIHEHLAQETHPGGGHEVSVETLNGSLVEYWV